MKLKTRIILLTGMFLLAIFGATAQGVKQLINLKIGDKVPDVTIKNILNYKTKSAKISDFRGKILIVDFWATWCGACIMMKPKMDSLQKQFKNEIQFLSISDQDEKTVMNFISKYEKMKNVDSGIPEVVEDTVLRELFPHTTLPHYVWIDKEGIVRAITDWREVREDVIQSFLTHSPKRTILKVDDERFPYDITQQQFLEFLAHNNSVIDLQSTVKEYSFLTGYVGGLGNGGMYIENLNDTTKSLIYRAIDTPLWWLFKFAHGEGIRFLHPSTVASEVADTSKIMAFLKGAAAREWRKKNSYCYEVSIPVSKRKNWWEINRATIAHYFPQYSVNTEIRIMDCFSLIRTSGADKLKSRNATKASVIDTADRIHFKNVPMSTVVGLLNNQLQYQKYPVTDLTGYDNPVDLDLPRNFKNMEEYNSELKKYDLMIQFKKSPIEILVIRDK